MKYSWFTHTCGHPLSCVWAWFSPCIALQCAFIGGWNIKSKAYWGGCCCFDTCWKLPSLHNCLCAQLVMCEWMDWVEELFCPALLTPWASCHFLPASLCWYGLFLHGITTNVDKPVLVKLHRENFHATSRHSEHSGLSLHTYCSCKIITFGRTFRW